MKTAIIDLYAQLRATYWFIPALMAVCSILFSFITLKLDHSIDPAWLKENGWVYAESPAGTRSILSTIASSMITVAGVTFSMTIVAVSFAASQIGPRLTANFMRDRSNQLTLGTFISTFLYSLMILRAVSDPTLDGERLHPFIPNISLLFATIFALLSVAILIYFVHHIPKSINMTNVIARVGDVLSYQANALFPIYIGQEQLGKKSTIPNSFKTYQTSVKSDTHGYIRVLDGSSLIKVARRHDVIMTLQVRPGDYVTEGSNLLIIHSEKKITDALQDEAIATFAFGHQRNQDQDILFLIDEMVEIIARALSPGVNEPFTAMTCMDWLQLTLERISNSTPPSAFRYDDEEQLRIIAQPVLFQEFCDLIFCRIQPYVCQDRNVTVHVIKMIYGLHDNIFNKEHKVILAKHAKNLKDAALECLPVTLDRDAVASLYQHYFHTY